MSKLDISVGGFRIIHQDNGSVRIEEDGHHQSTAHAACYGFKCVLVLAMEIKSLREQLESARFDADPRHGNY